MARLAFIEAAYLAASVLFILGLRSLTRAETRPARHATGGARDAVGDRRHAGQPQIVDYRWIIAGLVLGAVLGYPLGVWCR